ASGPFDRRTVHDGGGATRDQGNGRLDARSARRRRRTGRDRPAPARIVSPVKGRISFLATAIAIAACGPAPIGLARVTIPAHATLRAAADSLSRAGLVGSPRLFQVYAK